MQHKKLVIAISGASGAIYGIRLLSVLQAMDVETHLVISKAAGLTITQETGYSLQDIQSLADVTYPVQDVGAAIASGSFQHDGMVIAPCSVKTMSEIATGVTSSLLSRAADVCLKERKRLVLLVRETPLHLGHLRTMTQLAEMGAIIVPPMPAFYPLPESVDDIVNHTVGRLLDMFGMNHNLVQRWQGLTVGKALQEKEEE